MNGIHQNRTYSCNLLLMLMLICSSCSSAPQEAGGKNKLQPDIKKSAQTADTATWKKEAKRMVKSQIAGRGISDNRVLEAMENTPRHLFMPAAYRGFAYYDSPMPIGEEQTISQPYIVAIMTELLQLKGQEKVLEIGTGSGYQAAILSQLTDTCYSIELIPTLCDKAARLLKDLKYNNVVVRCGDGYKGWPEHAPFDRIIITAAPEEVPQALVDQLKVNGRMVVPVGKTNQELLLITKTEKGIKKKTIFPVRFVPMVKPD